MSDQDLSPPPLVKDPEEFVPPPTLHKSLSTEAMEEALKKEEKLKEHYVPKPRLGYGAKPYLYVSVGHVSRSEHQGSRLMLLDFNEWEKSDTRVNDGDDEDHAREIFIENVFVAMVPPDQETSAPPLIIGIFSKPEFIPWKIERMPDRPIQVVPCPVEI